MPHRSLIPYVLAIPLALCLLVGCSSQETVTTCVVVGRSHVIEYDPIDGHETHRYRLQFCGRRHDGKPVSF